MLLLGIDIGTSSVKLSVVDAETKAIIASSSYPSTEAPIVALQTGWAEQDPEDWWQYVQEALQQLRKEQGVDTLQVAAIGIAYQMHGLVIVDKEQNSLRKSIIWCDSRAVPYGNHAYAALGEAYCQERLLNSPGNFTASKLAWVKENEPQVFESTDQMMLPGDYIAMKLTGNITTTPSALSEAILWDHQQDGPATEVMDHFGFSTTVLPPVQPPFSVHGRVAAAVAELLHLKEGLPVSYKAGDQINNAFALGVNTPGQVAANGGTSGVIYAVTDQLAADPLSRVNSFVHVNHQGQSKRLGVLLCINGTGIMNSWVKKTVGKGLSYSELNEKAAAIPAGSEGLIVLPFGNGAERMLQNRCPGAGILNLDLNKHTEAHIYRAVLEGVAFAFRYGLDILRSNGIQPTVVRAGHANLFLSPVFRECFVGSTGLSVELYPLDGSVGAAIGAGVGAGIYTSMEKAFDHLQPMETVSPGDTALYEEGYQKWKKALEAMLEQ